MQTQKKTKPATHYEHIDEMSAEFERMEPGAMTDQAGEFWMLRILLSISQQLSMISQHLSVIADRTGIDNRE
jgi:hypothetical protein